MGAVGQLLTSLLLKFFINSLQVFSFPSASYFLGHCSLLIQIMLIYMHACMLLEGVSFLVSGWNAAISCVL